MWVVCVCLWWVGPLCLCNVCRGRRFVGLATRCLIINMCVLGRQVCVCVYASTVCVGPICMYRCVPVCASAPMFVCSCTHSG